MIFDYKGKKYNIDEKQVEHLQKVLNIPKVEAIELFLSDSGIMPLTDEQKKLENYKIDHGVVNKKCENRKKRTVNNSFEKIELASSIYNNLLNFYGRENITCIIECKLYQVCINGLYFKINISQNRKKKESE